MYVRMSLSVSVYVSLQPVQDVPSLTQWTLGLAPTTQHQSANHFVTMYKYDIWLHCRCTQFNLIGPTNCLSQVLGFAAFFALVLKKVDQEEFGEPQIEDCLRNPGTTFSILPFSVT